MAIKTKIYCGHDFSEEEGRLNLVVKTCKDANIAVPQEVYSRLNQISDGFNQIPVKAELEANEISKRFRIKIQDIKNTKSDFIYFEFENFKTGETEEEPLELSDLKLEEPETGVISKFFATNKDEGEFQYLS